MTLSQTRAPRDSEEPHPSSLPSTQHSAPSTRIPLATYRLQFNKDFTFRDARRRAAYLRDLGVSDVYASPYLRASADSTHGYDVANHNQLNPAIGSQADYRAFAQELGKLGLGQVLDIVPNHMGIAESANLWWMDVLEHGPGSLYASFFDITWDSLKSDLRNKVLLPILGDQYGVVLENGESTLAYENDGFCLRYYQAVLPISPATYGHILQPCLGALAIELPPSDNRLLDLQSILTALSHLPRPVDVNLDHATQRHQEAVDVKRRVASLIGGSAPVRTALAATLRLFNGVPGRSASFDRLDALLQDQAYRLAYWRVASEEINYRRFFDVNSLAAIRIEQPEVFAETHRLILQLLRDGSVTGLRIDHPDGLWDPAAYLRQLQAAYIDAIQTTNHGPQTTEAAPSVVGGPSSVVGAALYVVVEKILARGEELPADWATHGTTGYDFAAAVGGVLVDGANRRAFDDLYARFIGRRAEYRDLTNATRKMIMLVSLASEVNALTHRLDRISEHHRRFRDFTLNSLTFAIREVIAALPVYRTYSTCDGEVRKADHEAVEAAIAEARRRNPRTEASIFDFIRNLLLLRYPAGADPADRAEQCDFVMKFQQTTGPVMAKGVEDTAFYVYNRLVSLNEVGGEPNHFGLSVADFHRQNSARQQRWPHAMLATSTHDTKRSEDVRARISVLSELPREWQQALRRWSRLNARHRRRVDTQAAPDRNDEYLLYQVLLGTWPFDPPSRAEATHPAVGALLAAPSPGRAQQAAPLRTEAQHPTSNYVERLQAYMEKATHEAKVHTSWINPNQAYDDSVREFVRLILDPAESAEFLESFQPLQQKVAHFGVFNSLSQSLLKLTSPGVPDIYQGNELWDLSLVDPDNRRPVDYDLRTRLLKHLQQQISRRERALPDDATPPLADLCATLLASPGDGRLKLYLTHRLLTFRQAHPDLFEHGSYDPLIAEGPRSNNVIAFARTHADATFITLAPRLYTQLAPYPDLPLGPSAWADTGLLLPHALLASSTYRDLFTGLVISTDGDPHLNLSTILSHFPVALLERLHA